MPTEALWPVPSTWIWTQVKAVGEIVGGGTPSTKEPSYWGNDVGWISPADLTGYTRKTIPHGEKSLSRLGLQNSSAKLMPPGSVHFSSRAPIGYVVISAEPLSTNQGFKSLIPAQGIFNEYVYYYLKGAKQLAEQRASGTTFLELSGSAFGQLPLPLPPYNEQRRIVAKIEELFSELDKGVESLKTAREQLKVYRQAVLKHAFEGKLTASWRVEKGDKLQTADELFALIQAARRSLPSTKGHSAPAVQTGDEPTVGTEPPDGWRWIQLGEAFDVFVGSTPSRKKPEYWGGSIPWVSSGEVSFCEIKGTRERITDLGYRSASTEIHPPGTVMLAMIGEGKTRGQAAILRVAAAHNQNTAAIRVSETGCISEYLYYFLQYQYEVTRRLGSGNNQKALSKDRVSRMIFPLCSVDEQTEIVRKIEHHFSMLEHVESAMIDALRRAEALRRSILKRAFSGRLVPQDPNDEPASVLLDRIRAEKTAQGNKPRRQRTSLRA